MSLRSVGLTFAALVAATGLIASSLPAHAAPVPAAAPAALDTCQNPTNAFVSLEVAPELTGRVPVSAGYHRLWDMAVAWKDVNPSPGVFAWNVLDQRVAQAQASGAIPMLVLGLTPQWAAANPNAGDPRWGLGSASPPADFNTFRAYVDAVVSRYGTRIGAYEIWNEANLQTFWTGTPDQMAEMNKIAFDTIKAKNPSAVVTAASVTTRLRGPMARFVTPYAQGLVNRGLPFDAWAIHTYPAGDQGTEQRKSDIRNWQSVIASAVGAGSPALDKRVWDTEVNYGLAGPGTTPHTDYTDAQGAAMVTQTFADSFELGIDATFWYLYTAAPFSLLGVQFWAGTPLTAAAWASARAKYAPGANLCGGGGGGSSPSPTPSPSPGGVTKTLTITADCMPQKQLKVTGTSSGLNGAAATISVRKVKKKSGKATPWKAFANTTTIAADGTLAFGPQRYPGCGKKKVTVKVKAAAGGVTSNVSAVKD